MSTSQAVFSDWMRMREETESRDARTLQEERALEEALAALVKEYSSTLYRVAYSVLQNAAESEDAVQEAFLRVLRHRDKLSEIRDHRVWLIRIVWNVVMDRKRRAKTRPETDDVADVARVMPSRDLGVHERAQASEQHSHIMACVGQLPEKERQVLLLAAFDELNSVEISEVLGISESSVRSRLFRARNQMAELMKDSPYRNRRPR